MALHAVTGAFGFSGKYIARRLLDAGDQVLTLTNSPDRPDPFHGQVRAVPFRFDDPEAMARSLEGVDVLFNTYWVRFNHRDFSHGGAVADTEAMFRAARLAGVRRVVHVSITNPDKRPDLEYFRGKAHLEEVLAQSGLSYAVVRPAVLFGPEDILINNIAWTLRRFPVFGVFGDGRYGIRPIHVDDLASLMVENGRGSANVTINALGPESYDYRGLVTMMARELGLKRLVVGIPPELGYLASRVIGKVVGDVFITRPEIEGLMAGLLDVPGAPATGETRLSEWVRQNRDTLGRRYAGEVPRRQNRRMAY